MEENKEVIATPFKAPARFEILLTPDDTGLRMKEAVGVFVFRFPEDKFAGGAERLTLSLSEEDAAALNKIFNSSLDSLCVKHKTCSVGEALRLPPPVQAK